MVAPANGGEIVLRKSRFSTGLNYCPIFRRLWTKVHQITSADAGEIAVCNAVFRLSTSCSVPEIFAIEVRSRPKLRRKKHVFRPPNFLDLVFKSEPISDHVAKFRGVFSTALDRVSTLRGIAYAHISPLCDVVNPSLWLPSSSPNTIHRTKNTFY